MASKRGFEIAQTTFALSHLRYGFDVTHAHNVFIDRETGARQNYAHHPAAVPLVLAAVFGPAVTRRDQCSHLA